MPKVHRTPIGPGRPVEHSCRDERGRVSRGVARSNSLCRKCNTWLVYVRTAPASRRRS